MIKITRTIGNISETAEFTDVTDAILFRLLEGNRSAEEAERIIKLFGYLVQLTALGKI